MKEKSKQKDFKVLTKTWFWYRKWNFLFQSTAILVHLLFFLNYSFPSSTLISMSIMLLKTPVKGLCKEMNITGFFSLSGRGLQSCFLNNALKHSLNVKTSCRGSSLKVEAVLNYRMLSAQKFLQERPLTFIRQRSL